jgi:hypothetical protein
MDRPLPERLHGSSPRTAERNRHQAAIEMSALTMHNSTTSANMMVRIGTWRLLSSSLTASQCSRRSDTL